MTPSKAVVLVRSRGAGTGRGGLDVPPALLPAANRALLDHALEWLGAAGVSEAAVVAAPGLLGACRAAATSPAPGLRVRWVAESPSGLGGSLSALGSWLGGEPFVLHLADGLQRTGPAGIPRGRDLGPLDAVALLAAREPHALEVVDLEARREPPLAVLRGRRQAGVAVLGGGAVAAAAELEADAGDEVEALARRLVAGGGRVTGAEAGSCWRFEGDDSLLAGNRFALEGLRPDYDPATALDTSIEGAVVVHPTARLEASIVRGPAVIGPGVLLRHAYVGPYTSIGARVTIEGAEIEHSVVLPGASIGHLGSRLEASVVGPDAHIWRDFRLPRALRLRVGEGARVSLG